MEGVIFGILTLVINH